MTTIKDIALQAGVAKSTVSRYLNNGYVSETTRKKIDKVIAETGYIPNNFARSLKAQHTNLVGVIIPRLDSSATNTVLSGIDEEARKLGFQLIITNSNQDNQRELENIEILIKQKVAGIILLAGELTKELKQTIKEIKIPILMLGQEVAGVHSIVHEDYEAGKKLAKYALSLGHRTFLFVGVTKADEAVGQLRQNGFIDTIKKNHGQVEIIETTFSRRMAHKHALNFLPQTKATYIACATDNIAMATLKAAYELGYQVPADFSLSGFGGYDEINYVSPTITSVCYPYRKLGSCAIDSLQKLIKKEELPLKILLPNRLLENQSTIKLQAKEST